MKDCLFCRIAAKELSAAVFYEDEATVAFLDIHPRSPGHAMIIPKKHYENIIDLPEAEVGPLFVAVKKVTELLQKTLQPRGFTIGINHGKVSGQEIDHLHVHVIPRYDRDGGGSIHSVVNNPPQESLEEIRSKILGKQN